MKFDYTRPRATAERLIARFGQPTTLRRVESFGDEWAPVQTETDTTITAVDLNERVRDASGTLVGETRRTLLVSTSSGVTPGKGDKVAVGIDADAFALLTEAQKSERLADVIEVRPLAPGGTVILWELDLGN